MNECLSQNSTRRKRLLAVYSLCLMEPLLQTALQSIGFPHCDHIFESAMPLWIVVMTICVSGLYFMRPARKMAPTTWLLAAAMAWIILRVLGERYLFYENDPRFIWMRGYTAWFLFYPVGLLLEKEELKKAMGVLAAFWITFMVLLSIVGILCTVNTTILYTISDATKIGTTGRRLSLGSYCVFTAQNIVLACNLALFTIFQTKKLWIRIACFISIAILFVALGLTDGVNGMLTLSLLLAMASFVFAMDRIPGKAWKRISVSIVSAVLVMLVCYSANTRVLKFFDLNAKSEVHISQLIHPTAEESEEQPEESTETAPQTTKKKKAAKHKKINSTMHDRTQVWESVIDHLRNNTDNILFVGSTSFNFHDLVQSPKLDRDISHAHCIYLQVLMEWGLPGFAIMIAFLVLFAISALRLLFAAGIPMWERFVPCMAISVLFSELADCFTLLNVNTYYLYTLFLFLGMTIGLDFLNRHKAPCAE